MKGAENTHKKKTCAVTSYDKLFATIKFLKDILSGCIKIVVLLTRSTLIILCIVKVCTGVQ